MTILPSKFATPVSAIATLRNSTILEAAKLNSTKVRMNFQNEATLGFNPAKPYTMEPRIKGGITRNGKMSKRTFDAK